MTSMSYQWRGSWERKHYFLGLSKIPALNTPSSLYLVYIFRITRIHFSSRYMQRDPVNSVKGKGGEIMPSYPVLSRLVVDAERPLETGFWSSHVYALWQIWMVTRPKLFFRRCWGDPKIQGPTWPWSYKVMRQRNTVDVVYMLQMCSFLVQICIGPGKCSEHFSD